MTRTSKILDKDIRDKVLWYIACGNYMSTACSAAGIHPETLTNWLNRAKIVQEYLTNNNIEPIDIDNIQLPDDIYSDLIYFRFFAELKEAEAQAESAHVANLFKAGAAGPQYWAASATYLERKHPDRWGKRDAIDVNVKDAQELLQQCVKALREPDKNTAMLPATTRDNTE